MIECNPGKYEMTIITLRGELPKEVNVYTSCPIMARRLDAICEQYPQCAQVTEIKRIVPRSKRKPAMESKRYKLQKDVLQWDGKSGKPLFDKPIKPKINFPLPEEEPATNNDDDSSAEEDMDDTDEMDTEDEE